MLLTILYFATARDAAKTRTERVTVMEETTVEGLATRLGQLHPALAAFKDSIRFSVNQELVPNDALLHDGDLVAVLPAVTGG